MKSRLNRENNIIVENKSFTNTIYRPYKPVFKASKEEEKEKDFLNVTHFYLEKREKDIRDLSRCDFCFPQHDEYLQSKDFDYKKQINWNTYGENDISMDLYNMQTISMKLIFTCVKHRNEMIKPFFILNIMTLNQYLEGVKDIIHLIINYMFNFICIDY